jgi:transcription-repair coupling factor
LGGDILSSVANIPAAHDLHRRVESGESLSCLGVSRAAQPFLGALLRRMFPSRPIVLVVEGLKTQESFQQDIETWWRLSAETENLPSESPKSEIRNPKSAICFYPAWEVLPHEAKLPHSDVISERLETLVVLAEWRRGQMGDRGWEMGVGSGESGSKLQKAIPPSATPAVPLVITTVAALMQRTFPADAISSRTRVLRRGDRIEPLDLVEWLEDQGYEPEAKVTSKGELSLRGGILDVYPLTSPWPVRLEFFGDELESLRHFDPASQISREAIDDIAIPPAGEVGILKKWIEAPAAAASHEPASEGRSPANPHLFHEPPARGADGHVRQSEVTHSRGLGGPRSGHEAPASGEQNTREEASPALATLLDYLPPDAIFLFCEPAMLDEHAETYARQIPDGDPFHESWEEFRAALAKRGISAVEISEAAPEELGDGRWKMADREGELADRDALPDRGADGYARESGQTDPHGLSGPRPDHSGHMSGEQTRKEQAAPHLPSPISHLPLASLDAFRPLSERTPDPQIAEAQRREFFHQLHRWLRQDYAVHVFCNNAGERQRFGEIWEDYGLGQDSEVRSQKLGERSQEIGVRSEESGVGSQESATNSHPTSISYLLSPHSSLLTSNSQPLTPKPHLGALARGFISHEARLVVVTDAEIFGRYKVQRPRRLKSPHAAATRSAFDIDFTELTEGDYVVHVQHGIGRYQGLSLFPSGRGRKVGGKSGEAAPASINESSGEECLVIEYAPADPSQPAPKLYVPVNEAHLVSKYVGTGKARPALNTLGGTRWAKTKAQAEEAVRDLAGELLSIQAARDSQAGLAYGVDTPWQREFESAFLYEETPDQMRAILDAKADMEKTKPMDRLICGDVGYGKTEVAIRAAFKAVMGGKQVALLVPTTVLAQQHFNTFRERMADYPIRVEQLSRFRSPKEQRKILAQLAEGAVDIVIGTHRLIQEDVTFKELGLVVIDEEQRFGVLHKEKFKMLRKLVDVLTLSATPIPRTLYLALTGARDMSTIETPPQDRLPVETIVTQYDERLIRDAIQRELNREGQVYFLHNRVGDISEVAARIKTLVPKARVLVGHGQMDSDELEEMMTYFVNGEADVLVSTTIIESGIDIPNANTIIIDRADRFGLSDLYQLRGRVGRYKHQAYAYLLLPRHAQLLSDVRKRISAIKQYSSLGSGFKIAMRDLEIRGAGNLLGSQQSGHITAVGFELYCQLLKQSVSALKGEKVQPRVETHVRLDFLSTRPGEERERESQKAAVSNRRSEIGSQKSGVRSQKKSAEFQVPREVASYVSSSETPPPISHLPSPISACIPLKYISEPHQRIEIYRKLAQVTGKPTLESLRAEIRDRFGKLPPPVELLLLVAELKALAAERGVTAIETKDDKLMLTRRGDYLMFGGKFPRLVKKDPKARLGEIKKLLLAL